MVWHSHWHTGRKRALVLSSSDQGDWRTWFVPVEVGGRWSEKTWGLLSALAIARARRTPSDEEVRRTSCWMGWEGMLACAESMGGRFVTVGFAIPTEEMPSFPHEVDGNHRNAGLASG